MARMDQEYVLLSRPLPLSAHLSGSNDDGPLIFVLAEPKLFLLVGP